MEAKLHNIISTHLVSKQSNSPEPRKGSWERPNAEDGPDETFPPLGQASLRNRHSERPGAVKPRGSKRNSFLGPGLQSERMQGSSDRKIFNLKKNIMEENIIANNSLSKKKTIKEIKAIQKFSSSHAKEDGPESRPKKSQFGAPVRNPAISQIKPITQKDIGREANQSSGFRSLFDLQHTHNLQEEIEKKNDLQKLKVLSLGMESSVKNSGLVEKELDEIDQ